MFGRGALEGRRGTPGNGPEASSGVGPGMVDGSVLLCISVGASTPTVPIDGPTPWCSPVPSGAASCWNLGAVWLVIPLGGLANVSIGGRGRVPSPKRGL